MGVSVYVYVIVYVCIFVCMGVSGECICEYVGQVHGRYLTACLEKAVASVGERSRNTIYVEHPQLKPPKFITLQKSKVFLSITSSRVKIFQILELGVVDMPVIPASI